MADLDSELASRLSALCAAVPVSSTRLDPVHRRAVEARHIVRMAWVTPLVALVVVVVAANLAGLGPFGQNAVDARWRSSVTEGDLELSLEAAQGAFLSSQPADVDAALTYRGPDDSLIVGIGTQGPIEFTIEGLLPPLAVPSTCTEIELVRDVPVTKELAAVNGDPAQFRLPHGLRRINASADLRVGGCGSPAEAIETSIVVAVADDASDIPIWTQVDEGGACTANRNGGRLVADPEDGLGIANANGDVRGAIWPFGFSARREANGAVLLAADGRVVAHEGDTLVFSGGLGNGLIAPCGDIAVELAPGVEPTQAPDRGVDAADERGDFRLTMSSRKQRYDADEPIDLTVAYAYTGEAGHVTVSHFEPEVAISIEQLDVDSRVIRAKLYDSACTEVILQRSTPREIRVDTHSTMLIKAASWPPSTDDLLDQGVLQLRPGRWRISAHLQSAKGGCDDRSGQFGLFTSVEIEVGQGTTGVDRPRVAARAGMRRGF
jgi:hypothetical protein